MSWVNKMGESDVFVVADNVYSPLGTTTAENFDKLKAGETGVKYHQDSVISPNPFYASIFDKDEFSNVDEESAYTKFEQLIIAS
ncbi:MAG: hypothetical protein ACXVA2_17090, partial [Mucilaginibacter sp.]